ncbi:MAG: family 43 glycosylhydrolase [Fusicatenibacter sp.]|nr:family 43 glycosylhydrolase [Lachnospiraceae bacterium]MDY2936750.1 family 43 glycosylhydrolase [Fusicatenibacter sp.]
MKKSINPLLPLYEYIPDVEARVYPGSDGKERLFLYGSHDLFPNTNWCSWQYRVYSAPLDDLADWTDHGVSFASRKGEGYIWNGEDSDGVSWSDERLYAPDVLQIDDRYWMVSCLAGGGLGMSFSDRPEGPFCPAQQIIYDDGEPLGSIDPALYAENGRVYLLWGQSRKFGAEGLTGIELVQNDMGIYAVALRSTKTYPFGDADNPDQGFGFYEGISIRKIGNTYYVIYPSDKGKGVHTMSYATAENPLGPYVFRGNLLENDGCDLMSGNNHGSLCEVNGKWYLFYHRGTGNSNMQRKVCAERLELMEDGTFRMAVMTNHGLGGPQSPYEVMEAAYATHVRLEGFEKGCYIEEKTQKLHPLVHITNGCCVEYRDFDFTEKKNRLQFEAEVLPISGGKIKIFADQPDTHLIGVLEIPPEQKKEWKWFETKTSGLEGVHTIYLKFEGNPGEEICELARFRWNPDGV